jgi:hypothetical protein
MLNNLDNVLLSTHKKTQEGETTLQHAEIVAGFLGRVFYPIFIIALMTVFTSCRDDENNISSVGEIKTMGESIDPSNPNNPYDIYGKVHNGIILNFLENSEYSGNDLDSFLLEYGVLRLEYLVATNPYNLSTMEYTNLNQEAMESVFVNSDIYSHQYLDSVDYILTHYTGANLTTSSIVSLILQIKQLEDTILVAIDLDSVIKKEVLIRTSIARHSLCLWFEQFNSENSLFISYYQDNAELSDTLNDNQPQMYVNWRDLYGGIGWRGLEYVTAADTRAVLDADVESFWAAVDYARYRLENDLKPWE